MSVDVLFHLLSDFPDEAVRNEVDNMLFRFKHPVFADLHDKYGAKKDALVRNTIAKRVKSELDLLCKKTAENRGEGQAGDLMRMVRELRQEAESRKAIDQEMHQNQLILLQSYSEYLDLSLKLLNEYRIPFKNPRDTALSYVLNSRVQTEAAQNRKKDHEAALALCPDEEQVVRRKQQVEQLRARVARLEEEKRSLQTRRQEIRMQVDAALVQQYLHVREDLQEKEWAAAQLQQLSPV